MEKIILSRAQLGKAAHVFYLAFKNYPQMVYYFPEEALRERYLEWYLGCVLKYAMRYGEVYTNDSVSGVACWLPPGGPYGSVWGYLLSGFLRAPIRFGVKKYMRVVECEDYTGKLHKQLVPGPHYYVWGLAVDPSLQRSGLGTQLMQPGLRMAREQNLPVYLETHDSNNIRFYEKLGFTLIHEDKVPEHNLPFWCFACQPS